MSRLRHFSDYLEIAGEARSRVQRFFFAFATLGLVINVYTGISLYQLRGNPLEYQAVDPTYWLFMLLHIPEWTSRFALLFDAVLFFSCIASAVWVRQNISCTIFFIFHFIYFVVYNMTAAHHYHIHGTTFMGLAFLFRSRTNFAYVLLFLRFGFCFMMFSAAAWKIYRGNITHVDQFYSFMLEYHADNLLRSADSWRTGLVRFLLGYKWLLHSFWLLLIALEFLFIAGFLTLRWDRLLLAAYLLFFTGAFVLMDIYSYDNLLFLLTLAPVVQLIGLPGKRNSVGVAA